MAVSSVDVIVRGRTAPAMSPGAIVITWRLGVRRRSPVSNIPGILTPAMYPNAEGVCANASRARETP